MRFSLHKLIIHPNSFLETSNIWFQARHYVMGHGQISIQHPEDQQTLVSKSHLHKVITLADRDIEHLTL